MAENKDNTVYILDSYGLIYRAYFALMNHPLTNNEGQNISALVIFFKNLKSLISKYHPKYLAAAFDSRTATFRHKLYAEYKANRAKTPEDLHAQVPMIEAVLNALDVPVLRVDGYEADDIIATITKDAKAQGRQVRILSGDKDLLQLVDDLCCEMQPDKINGGWQTIGSSDVTEKWGIGPEKILDYLSLVGDSADNVPGVKGVGDKTALKLLTEYGTLDGIYEHADEIKGALGEKIRGDKENAYFSKKLITLEENVPFEYDFEDFRTDNLQWHNGGDLLKQYGATQIAKLFLTENENEELIEETIQKKVEKAEKETVQTPVLEEKSSIPVVQNSGDYRPCQKEIELEAFIDDVINAKKTVAFDTETTSVNPRDCELVGFSLCVEKGKAIYVPVILPGDMFAPTTLDKSFCLKQLKRLFDDESVTVAMHNGKFDIEVLISNGMESSFKCQIFDTMIAAWILNSTETGKSPYSLETLGEKRLGLHGIEFSEIVPKGRTIADIELDTVVPYGAEDADFTFQLYQIYKDELKQENMEDLYYNLELKILPILVKMENQGIYLDKNELADFSVELSKLIEETEKEIYKEAGHEFNINSIKQLQTVLFEERGLKASKKTKTGYSTDTSVLEELTETYDDILPSLILKYRSYTKLMSTYVESLPLLCDKNSKIHTSFLQTGTATGRLSSHDPNLQNIPVRDENGRRIRSAFKASNGKVLISADYAQIELVVMAHLSGDKNLCDAFNQGIDVHKATASMIYNVGIDEVTKEMRRTAKTINFGVIYGMSAFRLAKDLGISRTQAKMFIDSYFNTYSNVRKFLDETVVQAKKTGYITTITGRKRFVKEILSANKILQASGERMAVNSPIQGSAADIVKKAMLDINEEFEKTGSTTKMLLQVHDELIFECDDNEEAISSSIRIIQEKMEHAYKLNVPLRVSIETGKSWGEFH